VTDSVRLDPWHAGNCSVCFGWCALFTTKIQFASAGIFTSFGPSVYMCMSCPFWVISSCASRLHSDDRLCLNRWREGACYSSIVMLLREARCSSPSCSLDSSIRREVCLHRWVARRIDVPHLQVTCIAHVIGRSYQIYWIRRCIMKDRANSLYQVRSPQSSFPSRFLPVSLFCC
jgi:hypothetical protein